MSDTLPEATWVRHYQPGVPADIEVPQEREPIKFYKLTNATAGEVLDTIRALHGAAPLQPRTDAAQPAETSYVPRTGIRLSSDTPSGGISLGSSESDPIPTRKSTDRTPRSVDRPTGAERPC